MSLTANKKRPAPTIASSYEYPIRNIDALYCSRVTYACARGASSASPMEAQSASDPSSIETPNKPCISCAYKIANFDIALDSEFTRAVPNVRPECCPRFKRQYHGNKCNDINHQDMPDSSVMGYQKGMSVLTVGDGDFTFSLAVARLVCGASSGKVVATSYEDQSTLRNVYPDFTSTLKELEQYNNTEVCYKVDATCLNETLPNSLASENGGGKYHRIIWNFPCTAISKGQDGQNSAMEENKELVRNFVSNALPYLEDDGEIIMTHKTKPPFCQWGLEEVALQGNDCSKFEYKGRLVFDKCLLKPYTPRKALDRKSFPCHDACIYVFGWKTKMSPKMSGLFQPTIPEMLKVTTAMIEELRALHLRLATINDQRSKSGNKRQRRKK